MEEIMWKVIVSETYRRLFFKRYRQIYSASLRRNFGLNAKTTKFHAF